MFKKRRNYTKNGKRFKKLTFIIVKKIGILFQLCTISFLHRIHRQLPDSPVAAVNNDKEAL